MYCARPVRVRTTLGGETDENLFRRFSYLSPATGINIFYLSFPEIT